MLRDWHRSLSLLALVFQIVSYTFDLSLPVVTSEHNEGVSSTNGSAHSAGQNLVGCPHISGELHFHVRFILLNVGKVQVSKVMDGIVCRKI